jgi:hypothetical protein
VHCVEPRVDLLLSSSFLKLTTAGQSKVQYDKVPILCVIREGIASTPLALLLLFQSGHPSTPYAMLCSKMYRVMATDNEC